MERVEDFILRHPWISVLAFFVLPFCFVSAIERL